MDITTTTAGHGAARMPGDGAGLFLTDSGLETTLIFDDGLDLPDFAAFTTLRTSEGRAALDRYVGAHVDVARRAGLGLLVDSATWRASADWGHRLGYDADELARANADAVRAVVAHADARVALRVSGAVGPRGDGYVVGDAMTVDQARQYHLPQVRALADGGADVISAITMTHPAEGAGVALAAAEVGLPAVVSFTVETDGRLPSGHALGDAIGVVEAATDGSPSYYMVNCAHPSHFVDVLAPDAPWAARLRGVRANASRMSHAELDEAEELDRGDAQQLAEDFRQLRERLPSLDVVGGCCGTDHRHVAAMARALA